jgi:SAM-dependent methyltransferase
MDLRFAGKGPGEQAPDGCSVELYRRLPHSGDLEPVRRFLNANTSILELGCGTGRLTRQLLSWGLRVTAVDISAAMLAAVPQSARTVHADIESLCLSEHFETVLLASCLINPPLRSAREAFVCACRRHVLPGGVLLLERHDPEWLLDAKPGPIGRVGNVSLFLESAIRSQPLVQMTLRYESGSDTWHHSFFAQPLSELAIETMLSEFGFTSYAWHGAKNRWLSAVAPHHVPVDWRQQ